jgi:hypothetical protein
MLMTKHDSHPRPVITQAENNTTLWIGHLRSESTDHFAGQTFQCPAEGILNNIQVYSSAVQQPGEITMTLYEFDASSKTWGPPIGSSTLYLQRVDVSRWIRFDLQPVTLFKGATYGFRLQTHEALIGIGEAASGTRQPFTFGHEWNGDSKNQKGNFFTYFSLAFKVELCA